MSPHNAHAGIVALGFLLILFAITLLLHGNADSTLFAVFIVIGIFLMLLSRWMYKKTGVVRVIKKHRHLSAYTAIICLGFILILVAITLRLVNPEVDGKLLATLCGIGLSLGALALWLGNRDKEIIRVKRSNLD